jgi:hypothetical protein
MDVRAERRRSNLGGLSHGIAPALMQEDAMTKTILAALALTISLTGAYVPAAYAHVDVNVGIAIPPPPVVTFSAEPQVVLVPQTQVYYVPGIDYDFYRYGGWWYVNRDGYWYSCAAIAGRSGRSPSSACRTRS